MPTSRIVALLLALQLLACREPPRGPPAPARADSRAAVATRAPATRALASLPASRPAAGETRDLPNLRVHGAGGCTIRVQLDLDRLDPPAPLASDVTGVALILSSARPTEHEGTLVLRRCDEGQVVRELPRAVFDAVVRAHLDRELALELTLRPPLVTCGRSYALRSCARTRAGWLLPGKRGTEPEVHAQVAAPGVEDRLFTTLVSTPSGPIALDSLRKGDVVLGLEPQSGARVATTILRVLPEPRSSRARAVALELADGRRLVTAPTTPLYVPAQREFALHRGASAGGEQGELRRSHPGAAAGREDPQFKAARELAVGDELLREDGGRVKVRSSSETDEGVTVGGRLDVAHPDTYFAEGFLIGDARHAKRGATDSAKRGATDSAPVVAAPEPPEELPLRAAPQSYDCGLELSLEVRSWPASASSVAWVIAPAGGGLGARRRLACATGKVGLELPRPLYETARATLGKDERVVFRATIGSEESSSIVECSQRYDFLACPRKGPAWLQAEGLARSGEAGAVCFVVGTPVATPRGALAIEELGPGMLVLARDLARDRTVEARVRRVRVTRSSRLVRLALSDGSALEVTPEHPFYLPALHVFRTATSLRPGDRLLSRDGRHLEVRSRAERLADLPVYNLSVGAPHTYFAGGVLVHNY